MRSAASEDIVDAAKLAGVHEMILQLQHGYDTEIGEAGFVLSGGQRQRVGLARAIFGQPSLLVLDEPNASLDQDGEAALNNTIETMKRSGTTILLIAHKPTMLAHVDKILFLQDGMVGAFGERNEVLKQLSAHRAKTRQVAAAAPQPGQITPPSGQPPAGSVSGPAPPSTGAPDAAPPERP